MTHPGRHHRAAPSHRQPRQRVGKFPALLCCIRHSRPGLGQAGVVRQAPVNGVLGLGGGWPMRTSQRREKPVEPRAVLRGCEPVPRHEQLGWRIAESLLLVVEHLQHQPGVQFGIIQTAPYQGSVLVVLDQVVIRIAGESQRIEPERVHRRQIQQSQAGICSPQVGQVEADQVVPQHKVRAIGQVVQPGQRRRQIVAHPGNDQGLAGVRPHTGQGVDALIRPANFQIQRQTARQHVTSVPRHSSGVCPWRFRAPHRHAIIRFPANAGRPYRLWLPSRSHAMPSTASKCRSADTRSAPVSMAWAAIHTSLVGMGLPFALSAAAILEYRSALMGPTGTKDT